MTQPASQTRRPPPGDPHASTRWLQQQLATAEDSGYFGPSSAIWQLHREAVLSLGLGRALLLQLAHPWVAQAVMDHSTFQVEPIERLMSTVSTAELMVFGSRRQADEAAKRIRTIHARITGTLSNGVGRWPAGTPYCAGDPEALLWVLATLMDTTVTVYEACFGPLPESRVETYLADAARLGEMVDLPPHRTPRTRASLQQYLRARVADGTVAVSPVARDLAQRVLQPNLALRTKLAAWPFLAAGRATTVALMPNDIRSQYGSILDVRHPRLLQIGGMLGRCLLRQAPPRVRFDPLASIAIDRAERQVA